MIPQSSRRALALVSLAILASFVPGIASAGEAPLPAVEQPLEPEHNPPGDIPDDQVFVDYASPLGFNVKVPEGWARRDRADGATFEDKYGRVVVTETEAPSAPDLADANARLVPALKREARAVVVTDVRMIGRSGGDAILISYQSNSDPNPVTNKAIRLENDRYYFWKDGKLIALDLSAPAGADNVDQWNLMSNSFRWR